MSEKYKGIVYLSEEQYREKYNAGTLDPNTQYETPDEPTYSQSEIDEKFYDKTQVDEIKQNLQDQITTATGGEFTKVTVGGVYQDTFNADTKANATDLQATNAQVSSLDQALDSLVSQIADEIADRKNADTEINNTLATKASETYVDTKIADLVNSAPETLDTLGEVAQAIADNESVVEALNSAIGNKVSKTGDTINGSLTLTNGGFLYFESSAQDNYGSIHVDSERLEIKLTRGDMRISAPVDIDLTASTINLSGTVSLNGENLTTKLSNKADLTNENQDITAHDITLQGFSMFDYCAGLGNRDYIVDDGTNYVRWSNGLQVCWGSDTQLRSSYNFPQPFKDTNYGIAVSQQEPSSARVIRPAIIKTSGTKFTIGETNSAVVWSYIAVGFWK